MKKLLNKLIGKKTNYPTPVLYTRILDILNSLEQHLVETSENDFSTSHFTIVKLSINLFDQLRSDEFIVNYFKANIEPNYTYIPRSLAFAINTEGDWQVFAGIRRTTPSTIDDITLSLWSDLLNRTNDAR